LLNFQQGERVIATDMRSKVKRMHFRDRISLGDITWQAPSTSFSMLARSHSNARNAAPEG
jgi:hypothetical protein